MFRYYNSVEPFHLILGYDGTFQLTDGHLIYRSHFTKKRERELLVLIIVGNPRSVALYFYLRFDLI